MDAQYNSNNLNKGKIGQEELYRTAIDPSGCTVSLDQLREISEDSLEERSSKEIWLGALEKPWFRK